MWWRALALLLLCLGCGGEVSMPSLQPTADVVFQPGLREDLDPSTAPPGALTVAQNVRYSRQGGIQPRAGFTNIPDPVLGSDHELSAASSYTGFAGKLGQVRLYGRDGKAYTHDGTTQLLFGGAYSTAQPRRRRNGLTTEQSGGYGQPGSRIAVATAASTVLIAASDGTLVRWRVEALDGGAVLASGERTGTTCSAVATGSTYYLIVQNGTDLSALPLAVSGSTVTQGSYTSVATLGSALSGWDASGYDATTWFLIYQPSGGFAVVSRRVALAETHSVTGIFAITGNVRLSVWGDVTNARVWCGIHNDPTVTGEVQYAVRSATNLSAVLSATTITTGTNLGPPLFGPRGAIAPTDAFFVIRIADSGGTPVTQGIRPGIASPGGTSILGTRVWHVLPLSKPDALRRVWCQMGDFASGASGTGFRTRRAVLLRFRDVPSANPPILELATEAQDNTTVHIGPRPNDFHAIAVASDRALFAVPRVLRTGNGVLWQADLLEYETAEHEPRRALRELAQTTVVTGQPVELFGDTSPLVNGVDSINRGASEIGFAYEPAVFGASSSNGSGSLTSSATYQWVFEFEWVDMYGRRHRSGVSAPIELTLGASDDTATFTLSALDWSQKLNSQYGGATAGPVLHAWRTAADSEGPFYRATPGDGLPVAFDATDGTVSLTDGLSDAELVEQEIIYTAGGALDNTLAPSARYIAASDERVALAGLWEPNLVQFSKLIVPGEPPQFADSPAFQVVLRGRCTGLAYQDGAWLAFTDGSVAVITGDGPNDQGVGQFFVRTIAADRGHTGGPVLETALGIIFRSRRGLEIIPRGNGPPAFIGAPVQRTLRDHPLVLGAALHVGPSERLAKFVVANAASTSFRVLVLDLDLTQELSRPVWSVDVFSTGDASAPLQTIGEWPDGSLLVPRDADPQLDAYEPAYDTDASDTVNVTTRIKTADLRPAGLAGAWRCCSMTALLTNCDGGELTMTVDPDGPDAGPDPTARTWTLPNTPTRSLYRSVAPKHQLCTAATLELSVVRTAGERGPTLHGATIDQQAVAGPRRTHSGER